LRVWDASSGKSLATKKEEHSVETLTFTPDGKGVVLGLADGQVLWRSGARWPDMARQEAHEMGVRCVAFAPDGRLATGGWDGVLRLWDADLTESEDRFKGEMALTALAFLPGGALAAGVYDGSVLLFEPTRKKPKTTLTTDG